MKKLIVIAIVLLMASGVAYAVSDSEPIATSVNVTPDFYINVSAAVANFGDVAQGGAAAAPITIGVTCYSNNGLAWSVNVAGPALTHTDLVTTIPSNPNLQLYGFKTGGIGDVTLAFVSAAPLPAIAANIYEAAAPGLGLGTWNLELPAMTVPADQKAGAYSTTITLTMTE